MLETACDLLDWAGPHLDGDLALHWDPADPEPRARSRRRMEQHFGRLWLWAEVKAVRLPEELFNLLHVRPLLWVAAVLKRAGLIRGA